MNQKKVKAIRNGMHYPKKRTYTKDTNGVIHADEPRKKYQQAKKDYKRNNVNNVNNFN